MTTVLTSQKEAQQKVAQEAADNAVVVKCGELACQHDSLRRTMEDSTLLSFACFQEKEVKKKKKGKKTKDDDTPKGTQQQYTMVLSDSVFFPEGGGQPSDKGTITLANNDDQQQQVKMTVSSAHNINGICVLTAAASDDDDTAAATVQHVLLSSARRPITVHQEIDWNHRFDVMVQHSAQHLISAVAMNDFDMPTHSFKLNTITTGEDTTSYIDFTVEAAMSKEQIAQRMSRIEELVNDAIRQNLPMTPTWLDPTSEEFKTKVRSRLLPAGLTGKIRLVEIGEGEGSVDFNTCCGTHVPTLGSLQMIKFFRQEKFKSTILRVSFAAGSTRLLNIMESNFCLSTQLTNLLSSVDHMDRVKTLLEEKKEKERDMKILYEQLAECRAKEVEVMLLQENNNNVAVLDLGATADMSFMMTISSIVLENSKNKSDGRVILLFVAGGDNDEGSFLLSGDVALVDKLGKQTAELLGGRGGGRNGKFQGKGSKIQSGLSSAKTALMDAANVVAA